MTNWSVSMWTLGGIAAGAVAIPSSIFILWKTLTKGPTAETGPANPLYGASRSRQEKFIFIDDAFIGVVLGRHLRNIRRIEHETQTVINLVSYGPNELHHNIDALRAYEDAARDNEEELPSPKNERSNFLRVHAKTKEQIDLVELAIDSIIVDTKRRKNKDEMKVPTSALGHIIGRNGDRIRKLSRQFRVRAQISQDGGDYGLVTLEGTPDGIEGFKRRILDLVDNYGRPVEGAETEMSVEDQIKEMVELKEKLEENTEMW